MAIGIRSQKFDLIKNYGIVIGMSLLLGFFLASCGGATLSTGPTGDSEIEDTHAGLGNGQGGFDEYGNPIGDPTDGNIPLKPCNDSTNDPSCRERDFPGPDGELATAVYEDKSIDTPDNNYADFITNFKVREVFKNAFLSSIQIGFLPKAQGAFGLDHSLILILDGERDNHPTYFKSKVTFEGGATIQVKRYDLSGNRLPAEEVTDSTSDKTKDIVIFRSTEDCFLGTPADDQINVIKGASIIKPKEYVVVDIQLTNPELNPLSGRPKIDLAKYRFHLQVLFQGQDNKPVDLANVTYENGAPPVYKEYGFVVPTNWGWPNHLNDIHTSYGTRWEQYNAYLLSGKTLSISGNVKQWYKYPISLDRLIDPTLGNLPIDYFRNL